MESEVNDLKEVLEEQMRKRYSPLAYRIFEKAKVAVAGLGGLGSNVAMALARVGIGHILLVDFDLVEPSNLNRQNYYIEDIGRKKTEALLEKLNRINPFIDYRCLNLKITKENALSVFENYDVVVEAFDDPESKVALINRLLEKGKLPVVSASGISGMHNPNSIKSRKAFDRLYIVGDGIHEAAGNEGLMAPRVMVAAGHQATVTCQILLNKVELGEENA